MYNFLMNPQHLTAHIYCTCHYMEKLNYPLPFKARVLWQVAKVVETEVRAESYC